MRLKTLLLITALHVFSPKAQTTTAVPFLGIAPDVRSAGMGDLGLATGADAWSGLHNAAKLPFAEASAAVGIAYTPWLRSITPDMYLLAAGGYGVLGDGQAVSAAMRYFNLGAVPESDNSGNRVATSSPREYSLEAGYSLKLSARWGVGLTVRYIHSYLGDLDGGSSYKSANAAAADPSLYYNGCNKEGQGWSAGLALANLGSKLDYGEGGTGSQPASVGLGGRIPGWRMRVTGG